MPHGYSDALRGEEEKQWKLAAFYVRTDAISSNGSTRLDCCAKASGKEKVWSSLRLRTRCQVGFYQITNRYCYAPQLRLVQVNVNTAFLNPDVKRKIYVQLRERFNVTTELKRIRIFKLLFVLKWSLGLKQAPKLWSEAVDRTLQRLKFTDLNLNHVYMYD